MRRKHLAILFALPAANALSLANFQQITSVLIPLSCQLTYDSQIPTCTKSDFNRGCSTACIAALNSIAQSVSDSCATVTVNSNTLLGIVKNGGIVAALCPILAQTTVLKSSTTPVAASTVAPAVSVTIPTNSAGNTGGLGFKTTSTTKSTSVPPPQSIVTTSRTSSAVSVTATSSSSETTATSSTLLSSADGGVGGSPPSSTTTSTSTSSSKKGSIATSTSSTTSKPASQPDAGSGGGSPFDISSSASRIGDDSILGLIILVMACVLTGR